MSLPNGSSPFLDLLAPAVRAAPALRRVAAGEIIVHEGAAGSGAFVLSCDVIVHDEVLNHVSPGELFREIACLKGATRTATVRAAVDSEILKLAGDVLRPELRRSPALLEHCLRAIARRFRRISKRETKVRDEQRRLRTVLGIYRHSARRDSRTHFEPGTAHHGTRSNCLGQFQSGTYRGLGRVHARFG